MRKAFVIVLAVLAILGFQSAALADYATTPEPYPQPHHPNQPYPHYGPYPYPHPAPHHPYPAPHHPYPAPVYPVPAPYVMCFAQGLGNGAIFYGIGLNIYYANQWALYACNSSGQYCQLTGCRY